MAVVLRGHLLLDGVWVLSVQKWAHWVAIKAFETQ